MPLDTRPTSYHSTALPTCGSCVFAVKVRKPPCVFADAAHTSQQECIACGDYTLYCANGKAFRPGVEKTWEPERRIDANGICNEWHKTFTITPPLVKKPVRRKPQKATA